MPIKRTIIGLDILPQTSPLQKSKGPRFSAVIIEQKLPDNAITNSEENAYDQVLKESFTENQNLQNTIEIVSKIDNIDLFNLVGLARSKMPDIIAVDNLMELASNEGGIIAFAKKIPDKTAIIQVSGSPRHGYQQLVKLAERYELRPSGLGHPPPLETAELVAKLAGFSIGYRVVAFEDEIKIVVSKTRGIGKGGWSAPRYERNMRISVTNIAREIEQELTEKHIDFDQFVYPKRTVFVIRTESDKYSFNWFRILGNRYGNDLADVRVSRIPKSSIEYVPLIRAPSDIPFKTLKSVILGVDPGTTTGLAIIDVKTGNLIYLNSFRDFGTSRIIRLVSQYGKTILVCTDVKDIPHNVQRIARYLGAEISSIHNTNNVSRAEKRIVVQNFLENTRMKDDRTNTHQRDALFAAIKGYQSIEKQIGKIKNLIDSRTDLAPFFDQLVLQVINGTPLHIAIAELEAKLTEESLRQQMDQQVPNNNYDSTFKHNFEKLSSRLSTLEKELALTEKDLYRSEKENNELKSTLKMLKSKIKILKESRTYEMDREERVEEKLREIVNLKRELITKDGEINKLYSTMEILKKFKLIWAKGTKVPIKAIAHLQDPDVHQAIKEFGINRGDMILILDPQGGAQITAKTLVERKIRAIIVPKGFLRRMSHLAQQTIEDANIPLLEEEIITYDPQKMPETRKEKIVLYDDLYVADKKFINKKINEAEVAYIRKQANEEKKLHQIKSGYLEPQIEEKSQLELMIESYQVSRKGISLVERTHHMVEEYDDTIDEDINNDDF